MSITESVYSAHAIKREAKCWSIAATAIVLCVSTASGQKSSAQNRCDFQIAAQHPDSVIAACTAVINSDRATKSDYYARGYAYYFAHRLDLALADLNNCIRLEADRLCISFRGAIYRETGKFDEAITDYRKMVAMPYPLYAYFDDLIDSYKGRAAAYEKTGRFKLAIDDYDAALKIISDRYQRGDGNIEAAKNRAYQALRDSNK